MGFVDRLKTGRHVRILRASSRSSPEALSEAKNALVAMGAPAVGSVVEALSHRESREPACEVLERILNEETLPRVVEVLATTDRQVQAAVAEVLRKSRRYDPMGLLSFLSRPEFPKARLEAVLLARARELSAKHLVAVLPDYEREARTIVYRLLESLGDVSVAPEITKLLAHEDWWIRIHAAKLLAGLPGELSEQGLVTLLRDRNKSVRLQAVKGLQRLGAKSAVGALAKILRDGDLKVQAAAIDALISLDDPSAVPHLVDVLKDDSEQARRGAVEVLNQVATCEAIQDLVHSLRDADWWVRVRSADALGTIGGERVVDAILGLMDDEDVHIRRYAVEILNTIPDGRSVESLLKALDDDDWWVRERSIDALGRTGDERAVDALVGILRLNDQTAPLCARALGTLGSIRGLPTLIELLDGDPREELTREALEAVTAIAKSDEMPADLRGRVAEKLQAHGVRLEKTRLRPMEVRTENPSPHPSLVVEPSSSVDTRPPSAVTPPARSASRDGPVELRPDEIEPGTVVLDRYRVIRKIGSGGFSTVFLVEDRVISDEMILKILSPHLSVDESTNQRFIQELKVARRITHPNVIRIHDLLEIGKSRAISMEYFEGSDLGEILGREKTLPASRGIPICAQICQGLAAAHAAGVIHRDVKPANVLVGAQDRVKLVDFGLAAVQREAENRLTRTGHLVGTPHYMAPELIRGEKVDGRIDLYSFGIMMYEMFTGRLPYDGDNPMNVLFRHLDGNAPPPHEVNEQIPATVSALVMRAMAPDVDDRLADAESLLREIEELGG